MSYDKDVTVVQPSVDAPEFILTFGEDEWNIMKKSKLPYERVNSAWIIQSSVDGTLSRWQAHAPEAKNPDALEKPEPVKGKPQPVKKEALQKELDEALRAAGLTMAESHAMLSIWMPDLVKPGTRLVYLMPRESYCRILPIEVKPAPKELVRIGLVIDELEPTKPPGP